MFGLFTSSLCPIQYSLLIVEGTLTLGCDVCQERSRIQAISRASMEWPPVSRIVILISRVDVLSFKMVPLPPGAWFLAVAECRWWRAAIDWV